MTLWWWVGEPQVRTNGVQHGPSGRWFTRSGGDFSFLRKDYFSLQLISKAPENGWLEYYW